MLTSNQIKNVVGTAVQSCIDEQEFNFKHSVHSTRMSLPATHWCKYLDLTPAVVSNIRNKVYSTIGLDNLLRVADKLGFDVTVTVTPKESRHG
jgi:hypothetical protein